MADAGVWDFPPFRVYSAHSRALASPTPSPNSAGAAWDLTLFATPNIVGFLHCAESLFLEELRTCVETDAVSTRRVTVLLCIDICTKA